MPNVATDDPYFSELRNIILPDAERQPDRSLAIVFGAIVEDHLTQVIRAHLIHHKKIGDRMFNGMGPLATFSAKIDLGSLLGLYRENLRKALHALRQIRNTFAHDMRPLTFESDEIKAKIGALEVIDALLQRRKKSDSREQFLIACKFILGALHVIAEDAIRPTIPAKRKL